MRCDACGLAECAREVADGKPALPRYVGQRERAIQMGSQEILRTALLPGRQTATEPQASYGGLRRLQSSVIGSAGIQRTALVPLGSKRHWIAPPSAWARLSTVFRPRPGKGRRKWAGRRRSRGSRWSDRQCRLRRARVRRRHRRRAAWRCSRVRRQSTPHASNGPPQAIHLPRSASRGHRGVEGLRTPRRCRSRPGSLQDHRAGRRAAAGAHGAGRHRRKGDLPPPPARCGP
jgi:hypothetical protein